MWCNKCKAERHEQDFTPTMRASLRDGSRWCNPCKSANRNYAKEYQKVLPARQSNEEDKQARRDYACQQRKSRPWLKRHSEAIRRARLRNAMPPWVDAEMRRQIRLFYKNCPPGYEVDHIHPLAGVLSCGLHVLWNLQYLSMHDNRAKSNRMEVPHGRPSEA